MKEEWFALDQIETTFFISGVYEIENIVDRRVYVGESYNIHSRIITHLRNLQAGNHENKAIQDDWDLLDPGDFRMRVVKEMPGSTKRERLDAEKAQENIRRESHILYVDIGVKEDDTEEPVAEAEPEIDGVPLSEYIDILKKPPPKKEDKYMNCFDCERTGKDGFINCDDDKVRCEKCARKRSTEMTNWILSRPARDRDASGAVWRRVLTNSSLEDQIIMGMIKYAKKFGSRPDLVFVNRNTRFKKKEKVAGADIRIGEWTPKNYIDFPLPKHYDRLQTEADV